MFFEQLRMYLEDFISLFTIIIIATKMYTLYALLSFTLQYYNINTVWKYTFTEMCLLISNNILTFVLFRFT